MVGFGSCIFGRNITRECSVLLIASYKMIHHFVLSHYWCCSFINPLWQALCGFFTVKLLFPLWKLISIAGGRYFELCKSLLFTKLLIYSFISINIDSQGFLFYLTNSLVYNQWLPSSTILSSAQTPSSPYYALISYAVPPFSWQQRSSWLLWVLSQGSPLPSVQIPASLCPS